MTHTYGTAVLHAIMVGVINGKKFKNRFTTTLTLRRVAAIGHKDPSREFLPPHEKLGTPFVRVPVVVIHALLLAISGAWHPATPLPLKMETPEIWHPARDRAFHSLCATDRNPSGGAFPVSIKNPGASNYATFLMMGSLSPRTFLTSPSLHRQFGCRVGRATPFG